jgi:ABC-2 type transport system ATP-binding protein
MSAPECAIRLDELARSFGDVAAVSGLSLEIGRGELFGLLGPNGAGKTTTLSMLATLLAPTSGHADLLGHDLCGEADAVRRLIGLAPQDLSLYPGLSGTDNVRFFGRLYGLRGPALHQASRRVLGLVGLEERADDLASHYSGGMKRRLNLACALVHAPKILLLDEPTAGVDPQSRERLLDVIREIAGTGTTVIYTTHYMEEAERLCERIAVIDQGKVIAQGTLTELLDIVGPGEVVEVRRTNLETVFMHLTGRALRD